MRDSCPYGLGKGWRAAARSLRQIWSRRLQRGSPPLGNAALHNLGPAQGVVKLRELVEILLSVRPAAGPRVSPKM